MKKHKIVLLLLAVFASQLSYAQLDKGLTMCTAMPGFENNHNGLVSAGSMLDIPDVGLINQFGDEVNFRELIKGKVVALNFIFTSCKTICPPMGANFAALKKLMADRVDNSELVMLTISIDPITDTPERLMNWSNQFEAGEGWTLLTGSSRNVNRLLKELEVYTALKDEHAPVIMLGKEGEGNWTRANGLADPNDLAAALEPLFDDEKSMAHANKPKVNHDENYFTNVMLVNQFGQEKRLYQDLMKDKIVIINPFFTECSGVCPLMSSNLEKIQTYLGDRLGQEVHILSLTVDYETDQASVLREYAKKYHAQDGWHFLTGEKENIEFALQKLGKKAGSREVHDSIFLIGNLNTKLWKKVNGLAPVYDIIAQLDSVINDRID